MVNAERNILSLRVETTEQTNGNGINKFHSHVVSTRVPLEQATYDLDTTRVQVKPLHFPPGIVVTIGEETREARYRKDPRTKQEGNATILFSDGTKFSASRLTGKKSTNGGLQGFRG